MHIVFIEKVNADGHFEITIERGGREFEKAIAGRYVLPRKLVLTKEQKEENKEGLMDLLTGAFCIQEMKDVTFEVKDVKGATLAEYTRSLYDDLRSFGNS